MAHLRVVKKSIPKKGPCSQLEVESVNLISALTPLLVPITNSITTLTETVTDLVNTWNKRDARDMERKNIIDFTSSSITAEMIAADTHNLSKNYDALKDQINTYQQNLRHINEKLSNIEKLLATMVKRQAKKRSLETNVLDILRQFEQFLSAVRKGESPCSTVEGLGTPKNDNWTAVNTCPINIVTLNSEDDYPQGSWLGDPTMPKARVRCPLRPDDLIYINTKCNSPEKMALTLLDYLFSKETLAVSNLSGRSKLGKKKLDPLMIYGIKCHLMYIFCITDKHWEKIKQNIDSKCRTAWKKRRLTSEYCIAVEEEFYQEDSQSKDSLVDYRNIQAIREEIERPKTRVIRTSQGDIQVLATDQVVRFGDLHILDGDHILPMISSDGEEAENGISLRACTEQSQLAIVAEDGCGEQSHGKIGEADLNPVSFVMEPIMETISESAALH